MNKKDNKHSQYALTVALNHKTLAGHSEGITKLKPFIKKNNWEGINYLSEKDDRKKCEKNNLTIALNVLFAKNEKIYINYFSKHNSKWKNKSFF